MNNNRLVTVINVNGSSQHPTSQNNETWLARWINNCAESLPETCPCCGKGKPEVGGHVRIVNSDRTQYILPMCRACNNKRDVKFNNIEKALLVPVNPDNIE